MPSAQKQQTTVSRNGATTTTTVTTTSGAAPSANFTQAELGSRSLARSIDKKMNEMNQKKSTEGDSVLDRVLARDAQDIAEDKTFGSTDSIANIPARVMKIIASHDILETEIIRMIHMPGANYFSVSHLVNGEKKYDTFLLDEIIEDPESKEEIEVIEDLPEIISPVTGKVIGATGTNTLGTIGSEPEVVKSEITAPVKVDVPVSEPTSPSVSVRVPITEIPPEPAQPVVQVEPTIKIAEFAQPEIKEEPPLKILLDKARMASAKEFSPYYSNHYKERQTGTFNQLFGNNQSINDSLFKTITDYRQARINYFKDFSKTHPTLSSSIDTVRQEQIKLADVLSHKKHGIFAKAAHLFNISIPTVIETRNRIIGTAAVSTLPSISEKLGIHGFADTEPIWKKMFAIKKPEQKRPAPVVLPIVEVLPITPEATPVEIKHEVVSKPEKKIDYKRKYTFLHDSLSKAWNINQPKVVTTPQLVETTPVIIQPEQVIIQPASEPVPIVQPTVEPVIEIPVVAEQVPVTPAPLSFSPDGKQHPEHLFT